MRFRAFGIAFSIPAVTLLTSLLAARLGMTGNAWPLFAALALHELAHITAARLMHVHIREICLMPFGGSARMENPYTLRSMRLAIVAAAGPAANLCAVVLCSAIAQWGWLEPSAALNIALPNLLLFAFNLLPALPLDGGRLLFALMQRPLGEKRALRIGLVLGRCLAIVLLAGFLLGGLRRGVWNIGFALAAIFILCSETDERRALLSAFTQRFHPPGQSDRAILPARIYHLDASTSARRALELVRPQETAWFVITKGGRPDALLDASSAAQQLLKSKTPDAALEDMIAYRISPAQPSGAGLGFNP